jgi:SagB-type dehydrogenase family enzyme
VSGRQTAVAPALAQLLGDMDDYEAPAAIAKRFAAVSHADELISDLLSQDVLVEKGSEADLFDAAIDHQWSWSHDARYFHYSTRRTVFEADLEREANDLALLAAREPPPPPFRERGGNRVLLPRVLGDRSSEFWDVLLKRRTRRLFSGEPVSLSELATILYWTWGAAQARTDPVLGPYVLKTSPSGGARHPVEVYPVALRVHSIPAGVYHYSVKDNALEEIGPALTEDAVVSLCAQQPWVAQAAVVFVMTAFLPRIMWKYRQGHAYRVVHLDAGHLGQTFQLVCTKLGLAPFTSAAIDSQAAESVLRLDGVTEVPIYVAAVGRESPMSF